MTDLQRRYALKYRSWHGSWYCKHLTLARKTLCSPSTKCVDDRNGVVVYKRSDIAFLLGG